MKINSEKIVITILVVVLIMALVLFGLILKYPGTISLMQRAAILEKYNISEDSTELIYNLEDVELQEELNLFINTIPSKYLDIIYQNDWKIIFVEDIKSIDVNEYTSIDDAECYGLADGAKKLIYMVDTDNNELTKMNLTHEIGHAIDYSLGYSTSYSLLDLYSKYKETGYTGYNESTALQYAVTNEKEFFATTFKDFIMYPQLLGNDYMDIYNYYQGIVYGRTTWK